MKKSGSLGSKDGKDVHFEDETCCQATKSWCSRNIIHMILLALAVAAVGGAVIGSLDSCSDTVENITVSREITSEVIRSVNVTRNVTIYNNVTTNVTVKQITPLSVFMLIDASASMVWREDNSITPCPAPATCTGARNYITSDGNAQGINDNTTRFSCRSGDKNLCWPTPTYATGVSLTYDSTQEGDRFDKAKLAFDEILNQLDSALNNGTSNKLRTGVIQWAHDSHGVILESHLTNDTSITRDVTRSMVINGDQNTCWAPGLCQCYSQLKNDPESLDSTKLCILMTGMSLCVYVCVTHFLTHPLTSPSSHSLTHLHSQQMVNYIQQGVVWIMHVMVQILEMVCLKRTEELRSLQSFVKTCTFYSYLSLSFHLSSNLTLNTHARTHKT